MFEIRNKMNNRLAINLISGTIDLLARGTTEISDDDFRSSHLQNLLRSGKVILVSQTQDKSKKKVEPRKVEPRKEVAQDEEITVAEESDAPATQEPGASEEQMPPEEPPLEEQAGNEPEEVAEKETRKGSHTKKKRN